MAYDEDLGSNPMFKRILEHLEASEEAAKECKLILVPKTSKECESGFQVEKHILRPIVGEGDKLVTFQGQRAVIENGFLSIADQTVKILFEETHYSQNWQKYQVFCIDAVIGGDKKSPPPEGFEVINEDEVDNDVRNGGDVQAAVLQLQKFYHPDQANFLLRKVEQGAFNFVQTLPSRMDSDQIQKLEKSVKRAYDDLVVKLRHITRNRLNFGAASQTYFLHCLYAGLRPYLCKLKMKTTLKSFNQTVILSYAGAKNHESDAKINQACLTKGDHFEQMVREDLADSIPESRNELVKLSLATSPKAKLTCLNKMFTILSKKARSPVSSDDQLPWMIAVLSKSKVFNLASQLDYMANFNLDPGNESLSSAEQFSLTTLEAALEYLKSQASNAILVPKTSLFKTSNGVLDSLCDFIYDNDVQSATKLVKDYLHKTDTKCHPLCDCDKCSVGKKIAVQSKP